MSWVCCQKEFLVLSRKEFKDTPNKLSNWWFYERTVHSQEGDSGQAQRTAAAPKNKEA